MHTCSVCGNCMLAWCILKYVGFACDSTLCTRRSVQYEISGIFTSSQTDKFFVCSWQTEVQGSIPCGVWQFFFFTCTWLTCTFLYNCWEKFSQPKVKKFLFWSFFLHNLFRLNYACKMALTVHITSHSYEMGACHCEASGNDFECSWLIFMLGA